LLYELRVARLTHQRDVFSFDSMQDPWIFLMKGKRIARTIRNGHWDIFFEERMVDRPFQNLHLDRYRAGISRVANVF
jgi:hypothetical protein